MRRCVLLLAAAVLSCAPTPPPRHAEPEAMHGPPRPWAELSREERGAYMAHEVLPAMQAMFAEYDAARWGDLSCATCHGPEAAARNFAMPNPALLALHPTGSPEQHAMVRQYPDGVRFMFQRVLPGMQALLGAEPFDAATGSGFSCYGCHPHADDGPAEASSGT